MDLIYLNEKLKGTELEKDSFEFNFIEDFVPEKVFFGGIGIKEGFPGNIYMNLNISGYIKGFEDFKVNTFRRKILFENGKPKAEFLELKNPVSDIFDDNEYIDLAEEGFIDEDKNLIFLNNVSVFPEKILEEYKDKEESVLIDSFLNLTEKYIEKKIDLKVLKFIEDSKLSESAIKIPDELKEYVSPKGFLIEPSVNRQKYNKIKPNVSISLKVLNSIPSVNSVIKKINENKKLNFIENLLNKRLNYYLSHDVDFSAVKRYLNNELLRYSFNREALRKIFEDKNIKNVKISKSINIAGEKYDTIITVKKNIDSVDINKKINNPDI
jgi:hypothetical protein